MVDTTLTVTEARVLFTVLHSSWIPVSGSVEFSSAVRKLGVLGGGFCCRDCTDLAQNAHHLGGLVCDRHKPTPRETQR